MLATDGPEELAQAAFAEKVEALRAEDRHEEASIYERLGLAVLREPASLPEEALRLAFDSAVSSRARLTFGGLLFEILVAQDRDDEAVAVLDRTLEDARETDEAEDLAMNHALRGAIHARHDRLEPALESYAEALSLSPDRWISVVAHMQRARLFGEAGRLEESLEAADAALDIAVAMSTGPTIAEAALLSAQVLNGLSRFDEEARRLRLAVRETQRHDPEDVLRIRGLLGRSLYFAGREAEAAEELDEVLAALEEQAGPLDVRGVAGFWLGQALRGLGESLSALRVWSQALEDLEAAEDHRMAADTAGSISQLVAQYEDEDEAIAMAERAVTLARRAADDPITLVRTLQLLGDVRAMAGEISALDALEEARRIAQEAGSDWHVADIVDSTAKALHALGRTTEALPLGLQAADAYAAEGDERSSALAELFVASVLAGLQRHDEAAPIFAAALPKVRELPDSFTAASFAYGDTLDALGRHAEAQAVRSTLD